MDERVPIIPAVGKGCQVVREIYAAVHQLRDVMRQGNFIILHDTQDEDAILTVGSSIGAPNLDWGRIREEVLVAHEERVVEEDIDSKLDIL